MPFLVFYERKIYCFAGELLGNNLLRYKKVYFPGPDKTKDIYGEELSRADSLKLEGRVVTLFCKNRVFKTIFTPLSNFAPEFPFLVQFS